MRRDPLERAFFAGVALGCVITALVGVLDRAMSGAGWLHDALIIGYGLILVTCLLGAINA